MALTAMKDRSAQLRTALESPDSFATTLLVITLDALGPEALSWAPETILLELRDELGAKLPRVNADKLMAAITILTTDDFYASLPDFIALGESLAGGGFDPLTVDLLDVEEAAWAVVEAGLLDPEAAEAGPQDEEIAYYLGAILAEEGYLTPPRPLIGARGMKDPLGEFAGDPAMYQLLFDGQRTRALELEAMVQENLAELFDQLESLPLRNGSTRELRKRLRLSAS